MSEAEKDRMAALGAHCIDASTFQKPLFELAETVALKVDREGAGLLSAPGYVSLDLFVLMRQAGITVSLLFYINADERREGDPFWTPAYTFVTAPLVRSIIDCLYNITFILQNPRVNGAAFRKSGYKKELSDLNEDEKRYGGRPEWDAYIKDKRARIDLAMRVDGLTMNDLLSQASWRTLGAYLRDAPGGILTPHQLFLKTFTHGIWREYSAMVHAGFEGLMDTAVFYTRDAHKPEFKAKMDEHYPMQMSLHLSRAAALLLCIITEVQAHFSFGGANINRRIHTVWNALMPVFEIKELYSERYAQLMRDKRIDP
jgi:hypothetical protein